MTNSCCQHGHGHHHAHAIPTAGSEEVAIDPVCGMKVKVAGAKNTAVHEGHTYYFCSPRCLAKFTASPDTYLKPTEQPAKPSPAG